ncbi:MAG: hypothetical protein IJO56_06430 [Oscillospiraceae bacterium]|nr:hypothetical protein [Oscillospiraceae bacterium]
MDIRNAAVPFLKHQWCDACIFILIWLIGGVAGCALAGQVEEVSFSWMRTAPMCCASIVALLAVTLLPFLITAAAVYFHQSWLFLLFGFCTCCAGTFVSNICIGVFGSAGWLVRYLLLFSHIAVSPMLFWLWLCCCTGQLTHIYRNILLCAGVSCVIAVMDHLFISPYLALLIG